MIYLKNRNKHLVGLVYLILPAIASAHDPVFSPGPHLPFKNGVEVHLEAARKGQGDETENEQAITVQYGLTGDWVAGIELPYQVDQSPSATQKGVGDTTLSTKYRFWRNDSLGVQETAAALIKVKLNSGSAKTSTHTTDTLLGLTYGYESLKWYRWTSLRYRFNQNNQTLQRGDRIFVDFAGGYRPQVNDYRKPDTVWLLELNGEYIQKNTQNNVGLTNSGGNEWFISPGLMWTVRNFAIKTGVQLPIINNLNGDQAKTDYRARIEFELHL